MRTIALPIRLPGLSPVLTGLAALFVVLAVIGGVRAYSIVPFWDMWSSYVPFMDYAASGNWSDWWVQHNEHRIVLARLLFWADLRWFDGAGWFLTAVNYILVALAAALFCRTLREVELPPGRADDMHALNVLMVISLFFWSQHGNLTWAFQSQFFLAQLLPLAGLLALYRSIQGGAAVFALAVLLGLLSVGTMANGVLALPLMTLYAALTRQGMRRIGVLAFLAALTVLAYFHGYTAPAAHGSLLQALSEQPVRFALYVLNYLGSPFHFAFGGRGLGRAAALLAGLFMVASALKFACSLLRHPRANAMPLALLFFVAYVCGTAAGTAGGRLIFGLSQALSSRYTTPALMAWAALVVLYAPALLALPDQRRKRVWAGLALLLALMLFYQLRALESKADEIFDGAIGALAIELRVKDQAEIGHIFPNTEAIELTTQAANKGRSIFGLYPYRQARSSMGAKFAPLALPSCQGSVEFVNTVEGDGRFLRTGGWLYEPAKKMVPQVVRFLDADGHQVGYALSGKVRHEIAAVVGKAGRFAGYRGYISSEQLSQTLTMRGEGPAGPICQLQVKAPIPYTLTAAMPSVRRATVSSASVAKGNQWLGADFEKSRFPDMTVFGSYVAGDADRGAIVLRVKAGDRLFYRSGPSARQQIVEIEGGWTAAMPPANDWVQLEFSNPALPKNAFTVKLTDNGSGWGEWSAIALLSN